MDLSPPCYLVQKRLGRNGALSRRAHAQQVHPQDEDDDKGHVEADIHHILLEEFLPRLSRHHLKLMG